MERAVWITLIAIAVLSALFFAGDLFAQDRTEQCTEALKEEHYIDILSYREDFTAMRERALRTVEYLSPERFDRIMKLIDAAEKSGDVHKWYAKLLQKCMGESVSAVYSLPRLC